jgi:sugar phosphate isomerase/epimerase
MIQDRIGGLALLNLGVTTRSFPGLTNAETAARMAEAGVKCTELCFSQSDSRYWDYNKCYDFPLTPGGVASIAGTYRAKGIEVPALGVFANCLAHDAEERRVLYAHFERHMEAAAHSGIPCLATECGFFPGQRGVSADRYESAFTHLSENLKALCELAEKHGLILALEPCVLDVVPSAKRTSDLIEQIGSPRLKVLLDPANLIANSSEEDMFRYLTPHVFYFHGKDRKINAAMGCLVGDGDIDWVRFLSLYREHAPGVPFILEYCNADNFAMTLDRVRTYYGKG